MAELTPRERCGAAVGLVFLLLVAAGCGQSASKPPVPGLVAPKKEAAPVPPKPAASGTGPAITAVAENAAEYIYDPAGRRDPFRSILITTEGAKKLEAMAPLLRTELGEMKLIGIVWGGLGYSAMVQTPDGKG